MKKLQDIGKQIIFNEDLHEYKDLNGNVLKSATQFLHNFQEIFDENGMIALACAKREGVTKEEILKRWEDKKNNACIYGTSVHLSLEKYINDKTIDKLDPNNDLVTQFADMKFDGKLNSEIRLYSKAYKLAGTTDLVIQRGKLCKISDFKTNERFDTDSKFKKKFLPPIGHVPDCHHTIYSMQILIYGRMLMEHGFDFEPGKILWINPKTRLFEFFDVLDLNKEVDVILEYYKDNNFTIPKPEYEIVVEKIWDDFLECFVENRTKVLKTP